MGMFMTQDVNSMQLHHHHCRAEAFEADDR